VAAIAVGILASGIVTHFTKSGTPLPALGNGDEGERLAFECNTNPTPPPDITVHFDTLKEKVSARCSCEAIPAVMQALDDCCNGKVARVKEAACGDRSSFGINCSGPDGGGLADSGIGNPTLRVRFFGGFTRSNWLCMSAGKPNPDLEQIRNVYRNCCLG